MAPQYPPGLQLHNRAASNAFRELINEHVEIDFTAENRPEQTIRAVDLLSEWVRLLPHVRNSQTSAFEDVIMHKVTTISNSPITGDESQQLALLHRLVKLQNDFSNYRGQNCQVEEMIDNRLKHLVSAQRIGSSQGNNTLQDVIKEYQISLMLIKSAMSSLLHSVPNVCSLVLNHTRTQYRVMVDENGQAVFNGIILRLDAVFLVNFSTSRIQACVLVKTHEQDFMQFMFDSQEHAAKLVRDIKFLAGL